MTEALFQSPFEPATEARWREAVARALKGADSDKVLVGLSADGFPIQPLYGRRPDAAPLAGVRAGQRWRIAARVDDPDPDEASAQALRDLEGGADMLALVFHGARGARGFGLPTNSADQLDRALEGVALDLIGLWLEPAPQARITARHLADVVRRRGLQPSALDIAFGIDPLGLFARSGVLLAPWADVGARLCDMAAEFGGLGFAGPFFACDGRTVHEAGGSEAQELAFVLASALGYLRALEAGGVAPERAEPMLAAALAIDADQFIGIAKLRALRRLWARLQQVCGLPPRTVHIHAETAWRMLTRRDVPVNMLRNAIAAFSAGVGGADSLCVTPHTAALGLPDAMARRMARNTQAVLMEESHLWRVVDPAAGAGGYEALTDGLCAAAWEELQRIEREGGLVASLEAGAVQTRIAAVRAARARDIATGRAPLTGTSAFPDLRERPETVLDRAPIAPRHIEGGAVRAEPLASLRLAVPFEALRDRAEALAAAGTTPTIALARLGTAAEAAPRASFAAGLFAAGGLTVVELPEMSDGAGGTDLIALTDAFKASGAALACLCGTDEAYAEAGTDAALALLASGARGIWLAGRPGEREAVFRAAGIGGFVFMGGDRVEASSQALAMLEAT